MAYSTDPALARGGAFLGPNLKQFVATLLASSATRPIVVRNGGTSLAIADHAPGNILIEALQDYVGDSGYRAQFAAAQSEQPINGWKAQYFSGLGSIRLRGTVADGASPLVYTLQARSISFLSSQETDGASVAVSINGVAQTAIACSGASSSYGQVATYTLDPTVPSKVVLTPPDTSYGYLEHVIFGPASPYADRGVFGHSVAYGGSGLDNHAGTPVRSAVGGMYTSATVSGSDGLTAVFGPPTSLVKPDLIVWSGPTNDYHSDPTHFQANLSTAVGLAAANQTAVLLVLEPANGFSYPGIPGPLSGLNEWNSARAAIYAVAAQYPDSCAVFDWDYALRLAAFAPHYHSDELGDPHPQDRGYGDAYTFGGVLLCAALGLPPPRRVQPTPDGTAPFALADVYSGAKEPIFAPVGTLWTDTSALGTGELKRKVAVLPQRWLGAAGARGLWELVEGGPHPNLSQPIGAAPLRAGSYALGTVFGVDTATTVSGAPLQVSLVPSRFSAGGTYTLSFTAEAAKPSSGASFALIFGSTTPYAYDPVSDAFVAGSASCGTPISSPTAPTRTVLTFTYPTTGQLAAMAAAGVDTTQFFVQFAYYSAGSYTVSQLRVEQGASATVGKPRNLAPTAINAPLGPSSSAAEPSSSAAGMLPGARWSDTAVSPALSKKLLAPSGVTVLGAVGVQPGDSVWEIVGATPVNLFAGALSVGAQTGTFTHAEGTYGPGLAVQGTQLTLPGGAGGNIGARLTSPSGTNLVSAQWYTLSFLWSFSVLSGTPGSLGLTVGLSVMSSGSITYSLGNNQVTWSAGGTPNPLYATPTVAAGLWQRASLKFQAYTSGQQASGSGVQQLLVVYTAASPHVVITVCDVRLEAGVSVTAG